MLNAKWLRPDALCLVNKHFIAFICANVFSYSKVPSSLRFVILISLEEMLSKSKYIFMMHIYYEHTVI